MNFKLTSLLASCFLVAGCYKTIEIDLPQDEPLIVFDALTDTNSTGSVAFKLTKTMNVLDYYDRYVNTYPIGYRETSTFDSVVGADVQIFRNGQLFERIQGNGSASYIGSKPLTEGDFYELKVEMPGKTEPLSGSFTMPIGTQPIVESATKETGENEQQLIAMIKVVDAEPGKRNYYRISTKFLFKSIYSLPNQPSTTELTQPIPFRSNSTILDDLLPKDPVDDFDGAGMENQGKYYNSKAYFTDELFDGDGVTIDLRMDVQDDYEMVGHKIDFSIIVDLEVIPVEQYLFMKAFETQQYTEGDPFSQPIEIYSNVVGATGVFAVPARRTLKLD